MFLRCREENPDVASHYKNRINAWFDDQDSKKNRIFDDEYLLKEYCNHLSYDFNKYKEFLATAIIGIKNHDVFLEYQKTFDSSKGYKNIVK